MAAKPSRGGPAEFLDSRGAHLTSEGRGAGAPGYLQIAPTLPWRYGWRYAVCAAGFIFVRTQSLISKAAFDGPSLRLRTAGPIAGFLEPTNKGARPAQPVGWDLADFAAWQLTSPNAIPSSPRDLNRDPIYMLPHLAASIFEYDRPHRVNFAFSSSPAIGDTWIPPSFQKRRWESSRRF